MHLFLVASRLLQGLLQGKFAAGIGGDFGDVFADVENPIAFQLGQTSVDVLLFWGGRVGC